ncbi:MAG: family 3 adenylate cyclase [Planctomycetia bacterium]|nr:family 3 adenylate cyclase [Planctomycetia bacterium]
MLVIYLNTPRGRQEFKRAGGPVEFGRGPERDGIFRIVIEYDLRVSRNHLRVEEIPGRQVRLENLSERNSIRVGTDRILAPGEKVQVPLPAQVILGETLVELSGDRATVLAPLPPDEDEEPVEKALQTIGPPARGRLGGSAQSLMSLGATPDAETLAQWFETVIAVQRAAAGSPEFYAQAAQALVDLVGLDWGQVLLWRAGEWQVAARAGRGQVGDRPFSQTVLKQVMDQRRTFYQSEVPLSSSHSLLEVEAVVASPIFGAEDRVVGAVYGSRSKSQGGRGPGIGPLEAQVVQLLASAVGVGLARLEQETNAIRVRVQFEQFFSADLARELARNPELLTGREREITVLFLDIRGFSRLSERIGPMQTCNLVAAVMDQLTARVREHEGVLVDYLGDGLWAMWNAPADQPDHAVRACRAALAMQAEMPALSAEWQPITGEPLRVGIGLNSGPALVGNTGSRLQFKYGALGHTVNLASRVEGATKHFGVGVLLTGATKALLPATMVTRRLCKTRVVNVSGAVDLYELGGEAASPEWHACRDAYENALNLYEAGRWGEACRALDPLLGGAKGNYDIPALDLLARAVGCLKSPPHTFDPVVVLGSK